MSDESKETRVSPRYFMSLLVRDENTGEVLVHEVCTCSASFMVEETLSKAAERLEERAMERGE